MSVKPYTKDLSAYLAADSIIDYKNKRIQLLCNELWEKSEDKTDYIKNAYEYVRDLIFHSADINSNDITCSASEVLRAGHGICFAKSHLLTALLRCKGIPAGMCYQKLTFYNKEQATLVYHGLNGVYLEECDKWIRLDARGNVRNINAQFSIDEEHLAYRIFRERGEEDGLIVYPCADKKIIEKLKINKTRMNLWRNLPTELAYNTAI